MTSAVARAEFRGVAARVLRDYYELTKPRIVLLILVTMIGSMIMAAGGAPEPATAVWAVAGTALLAGAGGVLNCYIDRDVDALMHRTRKRPLPAGRVAPGAALAYGVGLAALGAVVLWSRVNALAAGLAIGGMLFYVLVYSLWLKRRTPQNIVIGGAAGATGPLIGWAAVTGSVELPALIFFLVVFLWTPPHFWSLALFTQEDYRRAGLPMLPVVRGEQETRRQILLYTLLLVLVTLLPGPLGYAGWGYTVAAALLGVAFVQRALRLVIRPEPDAERQVFLFSMLYLALLFASAVIGVR